MLVQEVNALELKELITNNEIVFVDFWAEWCAPCKHFATVYEQVAAQYPNIAFTKVNIEVEASLAESFQIQSIPHLIIFKQGIMAYSESGALPLSALKELVEQALVIDINK